MRSLLLIIALLGAAPLVAQPSIAPGGIFNAASHSPAPLPNSSIAQGSVFIVSGANLGPDTIVDAVYPLTENLAGTSAHVVVNGVSVTPLVFSTQASTVTLLMPSSAPVGSGTITISFNGAVSAPALINVTDASFGIITFNRGGTGPAALFDYLYAPITVTHAAAPGDYVVLWGTGLGKIVADESQPPPAGNVGNPIVWVGGQQATLLYGGRSPCCAAVDQINFQIPPGITGCFVPIAVQTGNVISNFATIPIAASGRVCSDPGGLSSTQLSTVASGHNLNVAMLSLSRSVITSGAQVPTTTTTDSGATSFLSYTPSQLYSSQFYQSVSPGGCMVFATDSTGAVADPVQPTGLDAGLVEVGGANGAIKLLESATGYYANTFGTKTSGTLYLDVPDHTINVFGGADIGVFGEELIMPAALTWVNQNSVLTISRSQGVTVNWKNAVPNGYVTVTGTSVGTGTDGKPVAGARFVCVTQAGRDGSGQFTIPRIVLLSLPNSGPAGVSGPSGLLGIVSTRTPTDPFGSGPVRGIDLGIAYGSFQVMQNVSYTDQAP